MKDSVLRRAREEGTPVIQGNQVTFVWRGTNAPQLIGDFNDWDAEHALELEQSGPDLWTHTMRLPRDAYMEYAFHVRGQHTLDPLNPREAPDGLGHANNYFYMPDAQPTPLIQRERNVPRGTVTRYTLDTEYLLAGPRRAVTLYEPPAPGPWPLLVVFDGSEYRRRARLPVILDNLIAQKRIRPVALALIANGGRARIVEYACSETTLGFVVDQVLPFARDHLDLLDWRASPGAFGVLGASMGGLMALYCAIRAPAVFGRAIAQSSAFSLETGDPVIWDLVRLGPVADIKIWMDSGRFEWLLQADRRMAELLASRGYDVTYHEYNAGHNYPAWRDDVWRGLETVFPAG